MNDPNNAVIGHDLGNEFDLGGIERGKIHVKLGRGFLRLSDGTIVAKSGDGVPANIEWLEMPLWKRCLRKLRWMWPLVLVPFIWWAWQSSSVVDGDNRELVTVPMLDERLDTFGVELKTDIGEDFKVVYEKFDGFDGHVGEEFKKFYARLESGEEATKKAIAAIQVPVVHGHDPAIAKDVKSLREKQIADYERVCSDLIKLRDMIMNHRHVGACSECIPHEIHHEVIHDPVIYPAPVEYIEQPIHWSE